MAPKLQVKLMIVIVEFLIQPNFVTQKFRKITNNWPTARLQCSVFQPIDVLNPSLEDSAGCFRSAVQKTMVFFKVMAIP